MTSKPTARWLAISYGAKAHKQPFITGEPGKAPAWNLKMPSPATSVPSFFTPIFTHIDDPDVGPVPLNTSSLLIISRTGRPDFFDSSTATGSREVTRLPPAPP